MPKTKKEESAGGIIARHQNDAWEVLVLSDMNNNITFPKGMVEPNETPEAAAKREIHEEVGLSKIRLIEPLDTVHYFYNRDGLISKSVHYFLFMQEIDEPIVCQREEGIHDAKFVNIDTILKIIGYPKTNQPLLKKAALLLNNIQINKPLD
jgi:8-oxo-dGTP pyrophosphatase MutT (NUDIX family)